MMEMFVHCDPCSKERLIQRRARDIVDLFRPHQSSHRSRVVQLQNDDEVAVQGAMVAYRNPGYDGSGHGHPPQHEHLVDNYTKARKKRSQKPPKRHRLIGLMHSSPEPRPPKEESDSLQADRVRANEFHQPDPSMNRRHSTQNIPYELGPGFREVDVNEASGPSQAESQRAEDPRTRRDGGGPMTVSDAIYSHFHRAKSQFPSAHFQNEIPYPHSPAHIERPLRDLVRAYESAHQGVESLKAERESLQTKFNQDLAQRDMQYQSRMSRAEREKELQLKFLRDEHATWMKRIQDNHESERDKHRAEIQKLESDMELLKKEHEGDINKLKGLHRDEVSNLERTTKDDLAQKQRDFDFEKFKLQESIRLSKEHYEMWQAKTSNEHKETTQQMMRGFETEKARMQQEALSEKARLAVALDSQQEIYETRAADLRRQTDDDKRRMTAEYKASMAKMRDENGREMDRLTKKLAGIEKVHEAEKNRMKEQHASDMEAQKREQEEKHKKLVDTIEELNRAIVKRDHFKAMSDRELGLRFADLATEIAQFARIQWDPRREAHWPFPNAVFRNSENDRRMKKHVVQNTIWVILYERIFCTPFRVLGNEGKALERDWIGKYGQDGKSTGSLALCPEPTKNSEKWRYEAMKKCLEAISMPQLEGEANFNLKRGYESSLKDVVEDICWELEKSVSISEGELQRMRDLVRKAAQLWLDVGQQRYRLFLLMGEMPLRSGQASLDGGGRQDLVVVPELRRKGNAQGERLEVDELVSGCKGEFSVIYVR